MVVMLQNRKAHHHADFSQFDSALAQEGAQAQCTSCSTLLCAAQAQHSYSMFRYLRNITIPAAFIKKSDGDALKALLTKTPSGQEEVIVVMDWTDALPKADKVEWEFWSNSNDQCGAVCDVQKEFIKVRMPATFALLSRAWKAETFVMGEFEVVLQWSRQFCLMRPQAAHMHSLVRLQS